jgi:hypothetical protein
MLKKYISARILRNHEGKEIKKDILKKEMCFSTNLSGRIMFPGKRIDNKYSSKTIFGSIQYIKKSQLNPNRSE